MLNEQYLADKTSMFIKTHNFTAAALSHFRELQRTSFTILEETAASLAGGETEKEVAHTLVKRYRVAGAGSFFHLPVVLFGERTALPGEWAIGNFFRDPKCSNRAIVGAKWEEILVIEDGKARWLDDEPPHVRQWSQIAAGANYRPRASSA